ncbi:hypothetical protein E2C01_047639 [Portunus trituberculatus]|uniref:Uncharacterized protein n=1 Tax=Portunus trituberculatus TaxID=210409 RepID=A0A5B7G147_PORTR|nr:hypothetical protein [Portunus trituberculatus]
MQDEGVVFHRSAHRLHLVGASLPLRLLFPSLPLPLSLFLPPLPHIPPWCPVLHPQPLLSRPQNLPLARIPLVSTLYPLTPSLVLYPFITLSPSYLSFISPDILFSRAGTSSLTGHRSLDKERNLHASLRLLKRL